MNMVSVRCWLGLTEREDETQLLRSAVCSWESGRNVFIATWFCSNLCWFTSPSHANNLR